MEITMPKKQKNFTREWFNTLFYGGLIAIAFRSILIEPFNIPSGSMIPTLQVGDHIFITKWTYGYSRYSFPFGSWHMWNGRVFGNNPTLGDVSVFRNPKNESLDYVKRLVGMPGDTIQMIAGRLHINGALVPRENPRKYLIAMLPRNIRSVGYTGENFAIRGNELFYENEPAQFNYTIEYKSERECERGGCGLFWGTEYDETLPNGIKHSIVELSDEERYDNTPLFTVPENNFFMMGDNRDMSADSRSEETLGMVPRDYLMGRVWTIWYSHNYYSSMLQIWNWNSKMRWERFFTKVD